MTAATSASKSASPASRVAATRSGRDTAELGANEDRSASLGAQALIDVLAPAFDVTPLGANVLARPRRERGVCLSSADNKIVIRPQCAEGPRLSMRASRPRSPGRIAPRQPQVNELWKVPYNR